MTAPDAESVLKLRDAQHTVTCSGPDAIAEVSAQSNGDLDVRGNGIGCRGDFPRKRPRNRSAVH